MAKTQGSDQAGVHGRAASCVVQVTRPSRAAIRAAGTHAVYLLQCKLPVEVAGWEKKEREGATSTDTEVSIGNVGCGHHGRGLHAAAVQCSRAGIADAGYCIAHSLLPRQIHIIIHRVAFGNWCQGSWITYF